MVFTFRPDCFATSRKVTPRGVPATGDGRIFGAGRAGALYSGRAMVPGCVCGCLWGCACCRGGMARARTSSRGRTRAVAERERRNLRRLHCSGRVRNKRIGLRGVKDEYSVGERPGARRALPAARAEGCTAISPREGVIFLSVGEWFRGES